ncbi:MAG: TRAP transporter permease [Bradyrhizobium sp.]
MMAHSEVPQHTRVSGPLSLRARFLRPWTKFAYALGFACTLYYMWTALVGIHYPQLDRSLFIFFGIALGFAMKPTGHSLTLRFIDLLVILGVTVATIRFNLMYVHFVAMIGMPISDLDMVLGWFMVAACLESCRRALGWSVPIISIVFLIFFRFGTWFPPPFTHADFDARTIASYMFAGTDGLYSDLTYVLASQMFLFLVFGTFLLRSGASNFFSKAALALVGDKVGGTAKAAVASSAVIGSITGSAAANAAVVGTMTIPLMKAAGFKPHIAGGIEAAASTGGTILPPVMGVTAFLMVALTGIPYATIALYSAVPALLYFFFVYMQVHFYARRNGLFGAARASLPPVGPTLRAGWHFLLPVVVVVAMVGFNYSLAFIALLAIGATLVTSWLRAESRMGPRAIFESMAHGALHALPIMTVAGPVAIMSECLLVPGTGLRLTGLIISTGHGSLAGTLALVYAIAYVIGMGLSVVPAYLILATLAAPALIQLGVPVLAAHLLVTWWSQASNIKPPVAMAVYVTSSIAGSGLWETGWAAVLKGAGLFFLPVLFVYQPPLLLDGPPAAIALTLIAIILGIVFCAAGIEGYFWRKLSVVPRVVIGVGGILLVFIHDAISLAIAVVVIAIGILISYRQNKLAIASDAR